MQQGEVGADQVIVLAHLHLCSSQLRITGHVHLRGAFSPRSRHQRRITIDTHRLDTPGMQRAQQPAFSAAKVEYAAGLAA